ncbi:right-handed parallel beta-helix repeat-containing protein [Streptomyces sp. NPDC050560]|uniref:right-handed parallel beta-helix repeat-containing protein n=1 Tax=Streptomyces sp. NPDC050560 TaxID=3365630 RepID=UPI0037AF80B6
MRRRQRQRWGTAAAAAAFAAGTALGTPAAAGAAQDHGAAAAGTTVYVATDGKEGASGTQDDPFATVEDARDALAGTTSADAPGTVYLRGGTYPRAETVELKGAANSYVTYAAYPGEKVEFTGAADLAADKFTPVDSLADSTDAKWSSLVRIPESVRAKVYAYDLGAEGIPAGDIYKNGFNWEAQPFAPELVTDDATQTVAQYPNGTDQLDATDVGVQEAFKGARDYFSDKTPDGSSLPYDEMLKLPGPVYSVVSDAVRERYTDWAPPTDTGSESSTDQPDRDIDNTKYETDGWLSGYFGNNYGNDRVRIYSVNPEGTDDDGQAADWNIRTKFPTMYAATDKWTKFVAQNILGELDSEGEYYIDRYDGHDVLYYYPPGGSIDGKHITLTAFDQPFFTLDGVTGVTLKGLTLNGSTGSGVRMLDAESCTLDSDEIMNVSLDAVTIGVSNQVPTALPEFTTSRGGHDNKVVNSKLHDLGGGGVFTAGGDRKSLDPGNNTVEHNEIYNFSKLATYTPAGYMDGVGNTFAYNDVHDAPHMAIQIMGNDMRIVHNRFENILTNTSDQGVIYAGRDFTYLNNEIAYNYFGHLNHADDQAVYMDDGASGLVVHHNYFEDAEHGLFFNSGHSNVASDNVFNDVTDTGHDKLYHSEGQKLPVSNSIVVIERFDDMLKPGDGTHFTNTQANIDKWYAAYAAQYPNIEDWYVPVDSAGEVCAAVGTTDCTQSYVWEDPDSLYVPSHNVLTRTVRINTGDFAYTDGAAGQTVKTFSPDFNSYDVSGDAPSDFAFDTATGTFGADSALKTTDGFGEDWLKDWNDNFDLTGVGPQD